MIIEKKIKALNKLGVWIKEFPDPLELAMLKSKRDNPWFDLENQKHSLKAIANEYLDPDKLHNWISSYEIPQSKNMREVGLITAGNIPAVGFHDLLCLYLSGHRGSVKLSEKDAHLLPALLDQIAKYDTNAPDQIKFVDKLNEIDAFIATGSDNSKRYFQHYFGHLPNIIRGNRNSLAIIDENVSSEGLIQLGKDVFDYYGLGCRSVSQVLLPMDFNENRLLDAWEQFNYVIDNSKYENNFRYNYATSILNREEFKTNNFLILKKSEELVSRIACLHFKRYSEIGEAIEYLRKRSEDIQVCVTNLDDLNTNVPLVQPGMSQKPSLSEYADRVDTFKFLTQLS